MPSQPWLFWPHGNASHPDGRMLFRHSSLVVSVSPSTTPAQSSKEMYVAFSLPLSVPLSGHVMRGHVVRGDNAKPAEFPLSCDDCISLVLHLLPLNSRHACMCLHGQRMGG